VGGSGIARGVHTGFRQVNSAIHIPDDAADRRIPKYLLTRKEAAWSLGISIRTLDTMSSRGDIKATWLGGKKLFSPANLKAAVERCSP
jgi:hypothetical protein